MPLLRRRRMLLAGAALIALPAGAAPVPPPAPAGAAAPAPPPGPPAPPGFAALAARLLPAVVNIAATNPPPAVAERPIDPARFAERFRAFMHGRPPESAPAAPGSQSLGSGFIVDPDGLVVTNNHVIEDAQRIAVTLQDGTVLAARVVGRDTAGDLALLKVNPAQPLPAVRWGRSADLRIGDWVMAIGNPFGLGGTVTAGIVSGLRRDIHDGPFGDFIQTDAPINRGNSGGPLFDLAGQVIGVNSAIYSPTGGSVGIGFAIPSDIARADIDQLRRYGHPRRAWLGLQAEAVTAALAPVLGLPKAGGTLVASVAPDGPAARAGVRPGDVILRFDDRPLSALTLPRRLAATAPGTTVRLLVWRDGRRIPLEARLGIAPPEDPPKK